MHHLHDARARSRRGRWTVAKPLIRQRYSKARPVDLRQGTSAKSKRADLHQPANRSADLGRGGIRRPPQNDPPESPRQSNPGAHAQNDAREQPPECSAPLREGPVRLGPLTRDRQFLRFSRDQLSGAMRQRLPARALSCRRLSETDERHRLRDGIELAPLQNSKRATLPAMGSLGGFHDVTLAGREPERQTICVLATSPRPTRISARPRSTAKNQRSAVTQPRARPGFQIINQQFHE